MDTTSTTPKYQQLTDLLRRQILSGERKPGDRLPSFAEMGAEFGATTTTLSRVYDVLQREGLIVREQGRGTFVLERRHRPATGTIGIVGFYHNDDVPYYAYLLQGLRGVADREGYEILLVNESRQIDKAKTADGLLICTPFQEVIEALPVDVPRVSMIFDVPGIECVVANDYLGAKTATEHLLELGHTRIGYMIPLVEGLIERRRVAGYHAALWEAGIEPNPGWLRTKEGGWGDLKSYNDIGRNQMQDWLRDGWKASGVTAILAANDEMAIGIIRVLQEEGVKVPQQVSVVGFDGTRVGEYFRPPLTSIEVPLRDVGAQGAEALVKQLQEGGTSVQSTVLPVRLKVRASTAPPPTTSVAPTNSAAHGTTKGA